MRAACPVGTRAILMTTNARFYLSRRIRGGVCASFKDHVGLRSRCATTARNVLLTLTMTALTRRRSRIGAIAVFRLINRENRLGFSLIMTSSAHRIAL